ncbi:hypothetical protein EDB85DRAFT_2061302 [Lactarius pseudohatsudake]|nr:hypothetical protein EDB85DRAFT_2061302 [Lactarius pseudohatsudake]
MSFFGFILFLFSVSPHPSNPHHLTTCKSMAAASTLRHHHPSWHARPITTHPLRYLTSTYKTCSLGWAPQVLTALPHASLWPLHPPFTTWESTTAATPSQRTRLVMTPCHGAITIWPQRCAKSHCNIDSTQCASSATTSCK